MILKYQKNILSAFLALTLLVSFSSYFYPNQAGAAVSVPTLDLAATPRGIMEWGKKMLGIILKRAILDRMVDQTVAWIQGDFKGKPPFLQNPEAFKKQVVDNAVGAVIQGIVPGLCSPFSLQLQIGIISPAKLSQEFACTLNSVVKNIDNFDDEFKQSGKGRWIKYAAIWEPQNNIWGATIMAESLKENTLAQAVQAENLSQTINLGFTATETCTPEFLIKTTPCQQGSSPDCVPDNLVMKETLYVKKTSIKCTSKISDCNCKIKTPGNFIASEVFGIASSGTEKNAILSADDVAGYVGTLLDAIISHYTQLGVKGLMGVLYPEAGDQKTEWDVAVRKAFSSLDAMTFNNTRTMYLDEIQTVLEVKTSSLNKVQALIDLIDQGSDIDKKLTIISTCLAPATTDQKALAAATLGNFQNYLNTLNEQKEGIENNVNDMNEVKIEMQNSVYPANPSDPSGQAEQYASLSLLAGYQDLKDKKILDLDAANKESDSIARSEETLRLTVAKANGDFTDQLENDCVAALPPPAVAPE